MPEAPWGRSTRWLTVITVDLAQFGATWEDIRLALEAENTERFVDYGEQRMRELCAARGLNWDMLTEEERERLVDTLLHET